MFRHRLDQLRRRRLTLFGRSLLLVTSLILANAACWIVAGILFGRNPNTRPVLSLALLAWVRLSCAIVIASYSGRASDHWTKAW
jgi:hypothetical protein